MNRLDIINHLVDKYKYVSYLECGTFTGYTLDGCKADFKIGVDPDCSHYKGPNAVLCITSDEFFKTNNVKFDIIFIDGLHEAEQVYRDIKNAIDILNPGGVIVVHDTNPPQYEHTTAGIDGCWTGDVYKAFVEFRWNYPEYTTFVVDTDWGCGIIKPQVNPLSTFMVDSIYKGVKIKEVLNDWNFFDKDRVALLNLKSVEEAKELL